MSSIKKLCRISDKNYKIIEKCNEERGLESITATINLIIFEWGMANLKPINYAKPDKEALEKQKNKDTSEFKKQQQKEFLERFED